jgi:hypothetical protein
MKKTITAVVMLVLTNVPVVAQQAPQTGHVSSVARGDQRTGMGEPCASHTDKLCYQYTDYTVEIGNMTYVLESDDTRQLEAGKDYEVKKIGKDRVTILVPGKKRPVSIDFGVKSVSEKAK